MAGASDTTIVLVRRFEDLVVLGFEPTRIPRFVLSIPLDSMLHWYGTERSSLQIEDNERAVAMPLGHLPPLGSPIMRSIHQTLEANGAFRISIETLQQHKFDQIQDLYNQVAMLMDQKTILNQEVVDISVSVAAERARVRALANTLNQIIICADEQKRYFEERIENILAERWQNQVLRGQLPLASMQDKQVSCRRLPLKRSASAEFVYLTKPQIGISAAYHYSNVMEDAAYRIAPKTFNIKEDVKILLQITRAKKPQDIDARYCDSYLKYYFQQQAAVQNDENENIGAAEIYATVKRYACKISLCPRTEYLVATVECALGTFIPLMPMPTCSFIAHSIVSNKFYSAIVKRTRNIQFNGLRGSISNYVIAFRPPLLNSPIPFYRNGCLPHIYACIDAVLQRSSNVAQRVSESISNNFDSMRVRMQQIFN